MATSTTTRQTLSRRRTQEERTVATRAKIIAAAIDCLYRLGFAEANTVVIAAAAGTSRGSMLHHFPSKEELLIAVAQDILAGSLDDYSRALSSIVDPVERLLSTPELAWEGLRSPGYLAWLEISLGTRSSETLRPLLKKAYDDFDASAGMAMRSLALAAGLVDLKKIERIRIMLLATMRGLAIEAVIIGSEERVPPAVRQMREFLERAVSGELGGARVTPRRQALPA